jgi:hypothetical protein
MFSNQIIGAFDKESTQELSRMLETSSKKTIKIGVNN